MLSPVRDGEVHPTTLISLVCQMIQDSAAATSPGEGLDLLTLLTDFPGFLADSWPWLLTRAFIFIATVFVFWILARAAKAVVRRTVDHENVQGSQLLENTIVSLTGKFILLLGIVVGLSFLGVKLGPVLAGLGIAGFVLGFALQDSLANFAAGAMILMYSPFDEGDAVEVAGVTGKVSGMSLVTTTILTSDNQRVIIPNSKIWGGIIKNITAEQHRRIDLEFGVGYADDIAAVEAILHKVVGRHPKVLKDPSPTIKLSQLGASSVDFIVRPWCNTEDYWDVRWDIIREVKLTFDKEGISMPYPQRDVHLHQVLEIGSTSVG